MAVLPCFGTYFYPPLPFEKEIDLSKITEDGLPFIHYDEPFDEFSLGNVKVFINQYGLLLIDTTDRNEAGELLNSIFLSTALLKIPVWITYPEEFAELKIDTVEKKVIGGITKVIRERGWLGRSPVMWKEWDLLKRGILAKDEFEIIIELAEQILNFSLEFQIALFTFFECYTEWDKTKYTSSFLFGWMMLEIFLSKKLEEYLVNNGVFQGLIDKLNEDWTVYKKLKYLKEEGIIPQPEINDYSDLRRIRNAIIHNGYRPIRAESTKCAEIAKRALKDLFKMNSIDLDLYLNKIKTLPHP